MKRNHFLVLVLIFTASTVAQAFDGLKFDANGRLLPSAFDKVKTFETDESGKVKEPSVIYYVSTTGNDNNTGTSPERPFRNISRAISVSGLAPGVAIRIMPGTYDGVNLPLSDRHGTAEKPIWIGGHDPTNRPILRNPGGVGHVSNCSYLILHDMEMTMPAPKSNSHIMNTDNSKYVVFRNLCLHHAGYQTLKFAANYHVWIFDCEFSHSNTGAGTIGLNGCHYVDVGYNYFHTGVSTGSSVYIKGGSADIDVHNNLFVDAGTAVMMGEHTGRQFFEPPWTVDDGTRYEAQDIRVWSNIIVGGRAAFALGSSTRCYFVNNTVIHPGFFIFRILSGGPTRDIAGTPNSAFALANGGEPHDSVVANNIFYFNTSEMGGEHINMNTVSETSRKSLIVRDNIFHNLANPGNGPPTPYEFNTLGVSNNSWANPLFVDPANPPLTESAIQTDLSGLANKYALKNGSPAVSVGKDYPFAKEDHNSKPFANPRSLGAIEK